MNLKRRRNSADNDDGMSSMTDLVFLMLIFFIIMSTLVNPVLPVDLPSGKALPESPQNPPVEVGVDSENNYFIDNNKTKIYTLETVVPVLEQKIAEQTLPSLKISGDKNASYESVFDLIAIAKQKDWKPVLSYKK
jgi:biopolymer transport protein ExbD